MSYNPNHHFFEWIDKQDLSDEDKSLYKKMYELMSIGQQLASTGKMLSYAFILEQLMFKHNGLKQPTGTPAQNTLWKHLLRWEPTLLKCAKEEVPDLYDALINLGIVCDAVVACGISHSSPLLCLGGFKIELHMPDNCVNIHIYINWNDVRFYFYRLCHTGVEFDHGSTYSWNVDTTGEEDVYRLYDQIHLSQIIQSHIKLCQSKVFQH